MPEDESLADLFALLDDEYARAILAATSQQPMSAPELAEACDASRPTIYRRIERLKDHNLITETTVLREKGHHRRVYTARFSELSVKLVSGEYQLSVNRQDHPADQFTDMWESL